MSNRLPSRIAKLDIHHVGYLTDQVPPDSDVEIAGVLPHFQCWCYFIGKTEYIIPLGGALYKRFVEVGSSLHHVAYCVEGFESWENLIYEQPQNGVGGLLVNFIHPKHYGILIELVQQ